MMQDLAPNVKIGKRVSLTVPNTPMKHQYSFSITDQVPMFTFVPQGMEIFHRLIMRGALCEGDLEQLRLEKSQL